MAIDGLMAAGGALAAGVDPDAILAGLASFEGVGRRFELKGDVGGVVVLDDYAHHPTAMRLTFAAARQRYPGRRLWAVYEPLTYHRTAAMLDRFAEVLAEADRAAIIDIWAVRDPDTSITSAQALADATTRVAREPVSAIGSPEAGAAWLADHVEPGDVVLVMGGGRSYVAADELVEHLRRRAGGR
jgi:UDP-N-acetylmuramate--alanine ligase